MSYHKSIGTYKERSKSMNKKAALLGFLTGGVLASVATLLYTPQSGTEFQQKASKNINELKKNWQTTKAQTIAIKENVKTSIQEGSVVAKQVSNDIKDSVQEWKTDVDPTIQKLEHDIEQLRQTLEKTNL